MNSLQGKIDIDSSDETEANSSADKMLSAVISNLPYSNTLISDRPFVPLCSFQET